MYLLCCLFKAVSAACVLLSLFCCVLQKATATLDVSFSWCRKEFWRFTFSSQASLTLFLLILHEKKTLKGSHAGGCEQSLWFSGHPSTFKSVNWVQMVQSCKSTVKMVKFEKTNLQTAFFLKLSPMLLCCCVFIFYFYTAGAILQRTAV